jgi:hypothetical protein
VLKTILISALFLIAFPALPQENNVKVQASVTQKEARFFRLDFVVRELDGKRPLSSRNYSMNVVANDRSRNNSSIRTGNRIPIPTSKDGQFTYSDIGINIDCNDAETVGSELAFGLAAELSSLSDGQATTSTPPILRGTRWRSSALVAIGKPTVVFTAEDEKTNHTLEMEVTATPLH